MTAPVRAAGHILLAEDEVQLTNLLVQHLTAVGHRVTSVADGQSAVRALASQSFDVALLDIVMPPPDGLEVLRNLADDPDPPAVVIMTGQGTIDTAVQAMRLGAFAYLAKPYRMAELDVVIGRALEHRALAHENAALRVQLARTAGAPDMLSGYAPLKAVFSVALASAASEVPFLIVGPTGSGKCSLARAIHAASSRASRPFIQLDGNALANEDVDRVLFGVERASGVTPTPAAIATRGTLYLHDVLALSLRTQSRLARAMREGRFRSIGSADDRSVRARVIAASCMPLDASDARVNSELADAFSAARAILPPLRERAVDISLLANSFLAAAGQATSARVDPEAMSALEAYAWPGNVAELRAVIERARLLARDGVIRVTDLALNGPDDTLELSEVERRHISAVLESKGWHQGRAADSLGISPKTLYRKIREFGLQRPTGNGAQ